VDSGELTFARRPEEPVLVIPGIGGHPSFHQNLIARLRLSFRVHTAAHVDFFGTPCADWDRHVEFWLQRFQHAAGGNPRRPSASVIGISFGAHVGNALRQRMPGAVSSLTLISYRHLPPLERYVLRRLPSASDAMAYLVGTSLFRLSEVHSEDRAGLRALRERLYDDPRRVRRRLLSRLVSLADAPPPPGPEPHTRFVFGADERLLRRRHTRYGGTATLVPGGHRVSVQDSPELYAAVTDGIRTGKASE
jgi:pimeloyl-ACP methyl ester carboxylesterase